MKRILLLVLLVCLLAGCGSADAELDQAMALRAKLLGSSGCSFDGIITADYGDKLQEFKVFCQTDSSGNMTFTVKEPQSISGITGKMDAKGGAITFNDKALAFPLLADGQVTPVSAPWILMKTLTGGYVASCGRDEDFIRVTIHDSYEADALVTDIWLDGENLPVRGEILYRDRRILTVQIENFQIL